MKRLLKAIVLVAGGTLGVLAVTPTPAKADHCHPSYRWEYRIVGYKWTSYTAYDRHGCPYKVWKKVAQYGWVKVYGN